MHKCNYVHFVSLTFTYILLYYSNVSCILYNCICYNREYVFNGCLASSESFPFCRKLLTILAEKKQRVCIQ